jgi:hypothetical protein
MCYAEAYRRAFNEPLGDYVVRDDHGAASRLLGHLAARDDDDDESLDEAPDDSDELISGP